MAREGGGMRGTPQRNLTCCVCGARTRGRQWWNRDTGFGVCPTHGKDTIEREGEAVALSYYGRRGYHWDVASDTEDTA